MLPRMSWKIFVLVVSVLSIALKTAASADIKEYGPFIHVSSTPDVLMLSGEIDERSALNFRRALAAHPDIKIVSLNSEGGYVQLALLIADDVYQAGISTVIPSESICYSACAFIFFAGKNRQANGRLGVHQIADADGQADSNDIQVNLSDVVEALNKYGVDPEVLEYMLRTSAGEMYIFSQQEIARLGLNRASQIALRPTENAGAIIHH